MVRFLGFLAGLGFVAAVAWSLLWGVVAYVGSPPEQTAEARLHEEPRNISYSFNGPFGRYDEQQLQRGFQVFREVCSNCHGLSLVAFRDLRQIGYTEAEVRAIADQWPHQMASINPDTGEAATRKRILTQRDEQLENASAEGPRHRDEMVAQVDGVAAGLPALVESVHMSPVRAWRDGIRRVAGAPLILAGVWLMTTLVSLPLTVALRGEIRSHLGASLAADTAASGVNYEWMQEFADQASGTAHHGGALVGGGVAPLVEAALGGGQGAVEVGDAGVRHLADGLAGGRIHDVQRPAADGVDPFVVDQQAGVGVGGGHGELFLRDWMMKGGMGNLDVRRGTRKGAPATTAATGRRGA